MGSFISYLYCISLSFLSCRSLSCNSLIFFSQVSWSVQVSVPVWSSTIYITGILSLSSGLFKIRGGLALHRVRWTMGRSSYNGGLPARMIVSAVSLNSSFFMSITDFLLTILCGCCNRWLNSVRIIKLCLQRSLQHVF